jgi:hypothetical protein
MSKPADGLSGSITTVPLNFRGSRGRFTSIRVVYGMFVQPNGAVLAGQGDHLDAGRRVLVQIARAGDEVLVLLIPGRDSRLGPNPSAMNG